MRRLAPVFVAALLITGAWLVLVQTTARQVFTVYFADATKLHTGDKITVLDVPVGKVLSVTPERDRVRVRIEVTEDQKIPAGAHATIVAPTMVSVRHVELSPAYGGGPTLADGASSPVSRTASPVEWDTVQREFTRFAKALGPDGANKEGANRKGALSDVITSAAANLDGQGRNLGETLVAISDALQALSDHRGDLFATVRNLDVFVKALASSDETIRLFTERLTDVSEQLSDDSDVLVDAIDHLGTALAELNSFLDDNSAATGRTIASLQQFTHNLASHRQHMADILQAAPTALSNYYNTYYPDAPAMTGTFVGANLDSPATFICSSLYSLGGTPSDCEAIIAPIAQYLKIPVNPIGVTPIERNGGDGASTSSAGGAPIASAAVPTPSGQQPAAGKAYTDTLDLLGSLMLGVAP